MTINTQEESAEEIVAQVGKEQRQTNKQPNQEELLKALRSLLKENEENETVVKGKSSVLQNIKAIWADSAKRLYVIAIFLQVFFVIMQFIPIMKCVAIDGGSIWGFDIAMKGYSTLTASKLLANLDGELSFFSIFIIPYIGVLLLFLSSFVNTIPRLFEKKENNYRKCGLALAGTIALLSCFYLALMEGLFVWMAIEEELGSYADSITLFKFTFGCFLYMIVGIALLVVISMITIRAKRKVAQEKKLKEEEEMLQRLKTGMRKTNEDYEDKSVIV